MLDTYDIRTYVFYLIEVSCKVFFIMADSRPAADAEVSNVFSRLQQQLASLIKQKENSKKDFWKLLTPVIRGSGPSAEVRLMCYSGCFLTCSNPSQSAKSHFKTVDGKLHCPKRTPAAPTDGAHPVHLVGTCRSLRKTRQRREYCIACTC